MRLYERAFVRRLRRGVRREIRRSPALRQEARAPWYSRRFNPRPAMGTFLPSLIPAVVLAFLATQNPRTALAALAIWGTVSILLRAMDLQSLLLDRRHVAPLQLLPTPDETAYRFLFRSFLRKSAWFGLCGLLVFPIVALSYEGGPLLLGWALGCAGLLWSTVVATAVVCFRRWPVAQYGLFGTLGATGCFVTLFLASERILPDLTGQLLRTESTLSAFSPAGWITGMFQWILGTAENAPVLPAVLALAMIGAALVIEPGLRRHYRLFDEEPELASEEEEEEGDPGAEEASAGTPDPVAAGFSEPALVPEGGWIDRWVLRGIAGRELVIADYLLAGPQDWTRAYLRGAAILLGLFALVGAIGATSGRAALNNAPAGWIYWLMVLHGLGRMTPLFGGHWPGFAPGVIGNRPVSMVALLPVGVSEARRVILKLNRRRLLLGFPAVVASAGVFAAFWLDPWSSLGLGVTVWLLLWLSLPIGAVQTFSPTTTDTSTFPFALGILLGIFVVLGAAVAAFLSLTNGKLGWFAGAAVVYGLLCEGFAAFYFRGYSRLRFDVMARALARRVQ